MQLTDRYKNALNLAFDLHKSDCRKGKNTPYMAHLLAVSAMVMDDGGTEEEAIGALLHDALEDHPDQITKDDIEAQFGAAVAEIVVGCTDTPDDYIGGEKPPWKERKLAYIDHLKTAPESVLKVALADKLHNAEELLRDLEAEGESTWDRFNTTREEQLWYLGELLGVFEGRLGCYAYVDQFRKVAEDIR